MHILIVSTNLRNPCPQISIQNIDSRNKSSIEYAWHDEYAWYDEWLFGVYQFTSTDARGNTIYSANIQGDACFVDKNWLNYWVVRTAFTNLF